MRTGPPPCLAANSSSYSSSSSSSSARGITLRRTRRNRISRSNCGRCGAISVMKPCAIAAALVAICWRTVSRVRRRGSIAARSRPMKAMSRGRRKVWRIQNAPTSSSSPGGLVHDAGDARSRESAPRGPWRVGIGQVALALGVDVLADDLDQVVAPSSAGPGRSRPAAGPEGCPKSSAGTLPCGSRRRS